MALEFGSKQTEKPRSADTGLEAENPEVFKYLTDRVKEQLSKNIATSQEHMPDTPRSYELMATYIANEAKKVGVSLESEHDVDQFFDNPMSHFAIAYAANVRRQMERGAGGE